jgi:Ca2+-binding EF-hand superfamily protein
MTLQRGDPIVPIPGRKQIDVDEYVRKYPHMRREEIQGLENLFCTWDEDGSGEISMDEMAVMLQRVVRDLFDKMDTDGSNSLNTKEVKALVVQLGQQLTDKEFKEAMNAMDKDNSGQVNFQEFENWWKGSEEGSAEANAEELVDLFAEVDQDGSGEIDVDEFTTMIATKMENKEDPDSPSAGPRDAMTMVRMALQSVRDDVRAIYGMAQRAKSALQAAQEIENVARNRRCFWTTENIGRPACVRFRRGWEGVQVFLLGYIAMAVPYRTGFGIDIPAGSPWFWFEVCSDIYFAFDIFLNFRTAYRTDEGDLIVDPKVIRQNYLSTWFAIDIAACFPLTYIELLITHLSADTQGGGFGAKLKAMKIARLLRLAKMLRLAKLRKVVKQIDENYSGIWTVSKLFSLILIILYISHIFACMWYFAGSSVEVMDNGGKVYGWVHRLGYDPQVDYVDDPNHLSRVDGSEFDPANAQFATGPDNWPDSAWFSPYLDAYYYAITTLTTVGYGDRTPHTDLEKIISIISELAGGITFGILAGTLSAMLTESNAADQRAEEQIDALKTFMTSKRVHKPLRRQITDQMEYFYKTKSVFDEAEIVEKLPPKFKKTLLLTMYKPQLQTCPLFAGLDESIITKLAITLRPYLGVEGDAVVTEGEVGDEMYMVVKGDMILSSQQFPKFDGKSWGDGAFFGELPMLGMGGGGLRNKHVYDVKCQADSDLTFLTRAQMAELERDYPVFKSQVRRLAAKRAERFGIVLTRVTVADATTGRRMSVALDSAALGDSGVLSSGLGMGSKEAAAAATRIASDKAQTRALMPELEEDPSSSDDEGKILGQAAAELVPLGQQGTDVVSQTMSHLVKKLARETDERIDRVELKLSDLEDKLDDNLPGLEEKITSLESGLNTQLKAILDLVRQGGGGGGGGGGMIIQPSSPQAVAAAPNSPVAAAAPVEQQHVEDDPDDSEDLAIWLLKVGLDASEAEHFREHGFDTTTDVVECGLSESDLKELGLTKIRQRKAVKAAIEEERLARGLPPSSTAEAAAAAAAGFGGEQLLPGAMGGGSAAFGYRVSPSRPRTADGAYGGADVGGGTGDLNLAEYKQLAVAAEQRIAGRRRMAANNGDGHRSMSPDERRKARSMFGRQQQQQTQQLEQQHARQVAAARSISPYR